MSRAIALGCLLAIAPAACAVALPEDPGVEAAPDAASPSEPTPDAEAAVARTRAALTRKRRYRLADMSLLDAVAAVSEASGLRIVFAPATRELEVRALQRALRGRHTAAAALDRLLEGTELRWRVDPYGTVRIDRGAGTAEVALETLTIEDSALADEADLPPDATRAGTPPYSIDATGASSTVLETPALAEQPIARFDDLLRRAPNVSGHGSSVAIRGIQRGDESAITASVYLDGIPLGGRALDFGLFGLDRLTRVEFQRGPRSLWEGVGALAGTIRLDTGDPTPERKADAGAELGDHDAHRARVMANGQVMQGLSARVSLESRAEPGFIDNVVRDELGNDASAQRSGTVKLVYEPDDLEQLTMRLTGFHVRGDPGQPRLIPAPGTPFDPDDRETYDPEELEADVAIDGARLEAGWHFNDRTALAVAGLSSDTREYIARAPDLATAEVRLEDDDEEARRETELRLSHDLTARWSLVASLTDAERSVSVENREISSVESNLGSDRIVVTPPSDVVRSTRVDTDIETRSALLELERRGERWDLALGVRHLDEDKLQRVTRLQYLTEPNCSIRFPGSLRVPCDSQFPRIDEVTERTANEPVNVPRFLLRYRPNDEHTLAWTYREGYLGGGSRLNVFTNALIDFDAERSESLDFAWDAALWDDWLTLRTTLFYNRWQDRQVRVEQPQGGGAIILNAAKARAWGGEIEARGEIGRRWAWRVGYGGLRTRYDNFEYRVAGTTFNLEGNSFPGAPERTLALGLAWHGNRGWYATLDGWHSGETYSEPRNLPLGLRPAYEVIDVKAGRRFGRWHVYGYVTNLLDEAYVEEVRLGEVTPTARDYLIGDPRQLGIGFEVEL